MDYSDLLDFASNSYESYAQGEAERQKAKAAAANLKASQTNASNTQKLLIIGGLALAGLVAVIFLFRSK